MTVEEALAHPTWEMGGRITIDSATLLNKGLEVIEAHHLFGVAYERIDVVVHPQSIVHSLIELNDGAQLAHLGLPDMRVPISYALHFPERADVTVPRLDLAAVGELEFEQPDLETFPCLRLAREAGRGGRDGAVRAQRRRRGRGRRLPRGPDPVHGDRRGDRQRRSSAPSRAPIGHFEQLFECDARARRARRAARRARGLPRELAPRLRSASSFLIIAHEAGHFVAAKAVGMRVERFFLFFPPKLWSVKRGETEYGIGAIPLGGFVKITGMNPEEELDAEVAPRGYYHQPVWKRIVVIGAGPVRQPPDRVRDPVRARVHAREGDRGRGRQRRGRHAGGRRTSSQATGCCRSTASTAAPAAPPSSPSASSRRSTAPSAPAGSEVDGCRATEAVPIVVRRDGETMTIDLRPFYDAEAERFRFGFSFVGAGLVPADRTVSSSADFAVDRMWEVTSSTVGIVGRIFDAEQRKEISGIVGSYEVTRQSIEFDTRQALFVLALISLSLAVINLFPFLPLDGGHIFWSLVEKVRGKPVAFRVMERASVVGFVLVLMLFVDRALERHRPSDGRGLRRALNSAASGVVSRPTLRSFWRRRAMEATTAERHASGGPGRELYAQNLALAFQATVERLGDDPAIVDRGGRREARDHLE